jgi:hypothetical protein
MNLCFIFLKTTTRFKLLKDLLSLMISVFLCCPCLSFRLSRSDMKCNAEMSHVDHSHRLYQHETITISSRQGIQVSPVRDNRGGTLPERFKTYWTPVVDVSTTEKGDLFVFDPA